MPTRRQFVQSALLLPASLTALADAQENTDTPVTGRATPALTGFDEIVLSFLKERNIVGGALAIVSKGRLVHARGFGWGDKQRKEPFKPTSLFRIASISKSVTAVAIMKMVQDGMLKLDTPAFGLLEAKPFVRKENPIDSRLWKITVRQLLHHTAGWDPAKNTITSGFPSVQVVKELKTNYPVNPNDLIRYVAGFPLDYEPGSQWAYCNFGNIVLGSIIEKISGLSYEAFVKSQIFAPMSVTDMRLGKTRIEERAVGEVRYYGSNTRLEPSIFPEDKGKLVPHCYGGFAQETGRGWLGSAVDMARFLAALRPNGRFPVLRRTTILEMFSPPPAPVGVEANGRPKSGYYGLGWNIGVQEGTGNIAYTHGGSTPGASSAIAMRYDDVGLIILLNGDKDNGAENVAWDIMANLQNVANDTHAWSQLNQFSSYEN